MELRNAYAIYICLAVVLVLVFLSFLKLHRKTAFSKGKKAVVPDYLAKDRYYKSRVMAYRFMKIITGIVCILSICVTSLLIARPYTKKMVVEEAYSRDIFLCMDISTSVDMLNEQLVSKLKGVVEDLSGERVGIVIFNTTPIILCPLTDDYEYVISVLDKVGEALEMRNKVYADYSILDNADYDEYAEYIMLDDYISSGTLVCNEKRGSSIIGDGLAATAYDFPDLKEDKDRVRIIIFTTDNDLQGDPLVTLDEAADICKENNIIVYGIGTEEMYDEFRDEMKAAVERTGGNFYMEEESGSMKQIVSDIDEQGRNLIKVEQHSVETEHPEYLVMTLTVSLACMYIFLKLSKR